VTTSGYYSVLQVTYLRAGKKIKLGYESTVYSQGRSLISAFNLVEIKTKYNSN
jgi:hypothetical protein